MAAEFETEGVVLIHGLGRTRFSMWPMARRLRAAGWPVSVASYPSLWLSIEASADRVADQVTDRARAGGWRSVNLVGHSLGGLIARHLVQHRPELNVHRVVQMGTPNGGTEVARRLAPWALARWILGPVVGQVAAFKPRAARIASVGSIAGTRAPGWLSRRFGLRGPNDGLVTVRSAWAGAGARAAAPVFHTFLPASALTAGLVSRFLSAGSFAEESAP
ncbi:MAG: alpha/beta fold hydrolase [Paracoccaceae bacterium]|nr:alpha/beta fold hydrolase [Paracoccaceae bacterium]